MATDSPSIAAPSFSFPTFTAAPAATSSQSAVSAGTDLATGIIVVIVLAVSFVAFTAGMIFYCMRRRARRRRQAASLAIAQQHMANYQSYPPQQQQQQLQQNAAFYGQQQQQQQPTEYTMTEMPAYPPPTRDHSMVEKDGEVRHEVYSPPATAEIYTGAPPSSELDGSYRTLPAGPNGDASSPMLRREHEQAYARSWKQAGRGS